MGFLHVPRTLSVGGDILMHKVRVVFSRSSEHIYLYFHVHSYQSLFSFLTILILLKKKIVLQQTLTAYSLNLRECIRWQYLVAHGTFRVRTHKPTTIEQCGSRKKKIKDVLVYDPIQPRALGKPSLRSWQLI